MTDEQLSRILAHLYAVPPEVWVREWSKLTLAEVVERALSEMDSEAVMR